MAFPLGDVNNFVVGSEDGSVYTACRHGRWVLFELCPRVLRTDFSLVYNQDEKSTLLGLFTLAIF